MGCSSLQKEKKPPVSKTNSKVTENKSTTEIAKKYNKHSIISNIRENIIIKTIGDIHGDAVRIEGNQKCIIAVMDHSSSVEIQECEDCSIFIAPCSGSIIIRKCKWITVILAATQVRITDVSKGDFLIYTMTSPAIETSTGIRLGCFCFGYVELSDMFRKAHLSVWRNCWSEYQTFSEDIHVEYINEISEVMSTFKPVLDHAEVMIDQYQAVPFTFGKSYDYSSHSHMILIFRDWNVDHFDLCQFLSVKDLRNINTHLIKTELVEKSHPGIRELESVLSQSSNLDTRNKCAFFNQGHQATREDFLILWMVNQHDEFYEMMSYIENSKYDQNCIYITKDDFNGTQGKVADVLKKTFGNVYTQTNGK